jgi:acetyltransferase-like isoleucine patch superfamily enzyme
MTFRRFILVKVLIPLFRAVGSLLFDRRFLRGRHFDASLTGWVWVWRSFWLQKVLRINAHVPWPVSAAVAIDDPSGIDFDPDDMQNFQHFGCYFSNVGGGRITIGSGTLIAPNVGIITTNHDVRDAQHHDAPRDVVIGPGCWLGMNSMILPGVVLGERTVVAAGAIVTRSFPEGRCVLVGNPAKVLRTIDHGAVS